MFYFEVNNQIISVNRASRVKSIFAKHFQRLVHKIWKKSTCIVLFHVKLQLCRKQCVEIRAKHVLQVKLPGFLCNFVRFNVFPKFTHCDCLNFQTQYCLTICIFSKCSGIRKILPPVWAPRVHRSPEI
jgi:hypothetical protein